MYLHIAGKTGIRLININELFMPAITHMHTYLIILLYVWSKCYHHKADRKYVYAPYHEGVCFLS